MVICLERGADLHMAQLMPLPLTISCFSEIQIGFTFLVLAHPGSPGKRAVKWRVCVYCLFLFVEMLWQWRARFSAALFFSPFGHQSVNQVADFSLIGVSASSFLHFFDTVGRLTLRVKLLP